MDRYYCLAIKYTVGNGLGTWEIEGLIVFVFCLTAYEIKYFRNALGIVIEKFTNVFSD